MRAYLHRIRRLEKRGIRASTNRTLLFRPPQTADDAIASVGKPGRYMVIADFGDEWERALRKQQAALIGNAKANTKAMPPQLPVGRFVDDRRAPNIALILRGR